MQEKPFECDKNFSVRAVYKIVTPSAARYAMIYYRYKEADA